MRKSVNAYAKINLFLDITALRDDGYHDIQSVMQSVSLCDVVDIEVADSFEAFNRNIMVNSDLSKYLSHINHPTQAGHELVAEEIAKYFIAR